MSTIWRDGRYAWRALSKRPGYTMAAVLTLALGIGANTAIFSVVNAVLLRPLPFVGAERLVALSTVNEDGGVVWENSYPNFNDTREQSRTLQAVAAYRQSSFLLLGTDEPELARGTLATSDLFRVLGARPALGRVYGAEEDRPGARRVAVLSHGFWQRRFGGDPGIVGREIALGPPTLVLGVMPPDFKFPVEAEQVDWYVPLVPSLGQREMSGRDVLLMRVVARRAEGASLEQVRAELRMLSAGLAGQGGGAKSAVTFGATPLHERLVGDVRAALLVLLGAVGLVLLTACANVANLTLARAAARRREIFIRAALGASRWNIIRQMLSESLLLSLLGGAAGLLLAWWGAGLLVSSMPSEVPCAAEIALDMRVVAFALALSALTGIASGLAPALQASKADIAESLKEGERGSAGGGGLRSALVVSQVALSLVLLVGAGLLTKSFVRLLGVDPGFGPERLLAADIIFHGERFRDPAQQAAAAQEILDRAASLPGVEAAAAVDPLPLSGVSAAFPFQVEGRQPSEPGGQPAAERRLVSAGYLRALAITVRRGRDFDGRDRKETTPVVIINETFARRFFDGEDPVGKKVLFDEGPDAPARVIVGVAGDVRHGGLERPATPEYYLPLTQRPAARLTILARTAAGAPPGLAHSLRASIREADKNIPVYRVRTMDELLARTLAPRRYNAILLGGFAAVALLLAGIGIYAVTSYVVARRTREIGIRLAFGARGADVLRLVVVRGMVPAAAGIALGLIAALALSRLLSGLLYGVSATDPATFAAVALGLALVALAANFFPARRATRVDPVVILREE